MNSSWTNSVWLVFQTAILMLTAGTAYLPALAHETGTQHVHFQRPSESASAAAKNNSSALFRRPNVSGSDPQALFPEKEQPSRSGSEEQASVIAATEGEASAEIATAGSENKQSNTQQLAAHSEQVSGEVDRGQVGNDYSHVSRSKIRQLGCPCENNVTGPSLGMEEGYPAGEGLVLDDGYMGDGGCMCDDGCVCGDSCRCEAGCGCAEPVCGVAEPGCGYYETGCGIRDPGCGIEAGCGCAEPGCGVAGCGSCVGPREPDYICFPVCIPRCKDVTLWAGVQGFRGPRDFVPDAMANPRSDSNFGFHFGGNLSGRAPLVSLLFPQVNYQLGYQAARSRLSGTVDEYDDRLQQFVTAGLFRSVETGLQFGAVWDAVRDELDLDTTFHQVRWEVSLRSPRGRELGFWSAVSANNKTILGTTFEAVNQYSFFYRRDFGRGSEGRIWAGFTDNNEGIFGGEFQAPLNDRWSVQTSFNYLIPEFEFAPQGVQEEAWNIGISLVWHRGCTARKGCQSPYRPMFSVANNGWMIIDEAE